MPRQIEFEPSELPNEKTNPRVGPKGQRLCNARNDTCEGWAMKGSTKCRKHGGATPRGLASKNLKHGRHSKALPHRLVARYKAALGDPDLLSLSSEIAVMDSLIDERLRLMDEETSAQIWRRLEAKATEFSQAREAKEADKMKTAMEDLLDLIYAGAQQRQNEKDLVVMLDSRRRLVESQRKALIESEQTMTYDQVMTLFTAVIAAVRENVKNPLELVSIQKEFTRITSQIGH